MVSTKAALKVEHWAGAIDPLLDVLMDVLRVE